MFTKEANFVHKICNICRQPFRTKQAAGDEAPAACLKKVSQSSRSEVRISIQKGSPGTAGGSFLY